MTLCTIYTIRYNILNGGVCFYAIIYIYRIEHYNYVLYEYTININTIEICMYVLDYIALALVCMY